MNVITVTFPTVTYAMKAKKVLAHVGIHSKLIKIVSDGINVGCIYALRIESANIYDVIFELKNSNIPYNIPERDDAVPR